MIQVDAKMHRILEDMNKVNEFDYSKMLEDFKFEEVQNKKRTEDVILILK